MEVFIEKLDHFGRGICHIDGKICFVDGALPGELCDIEIFKEDKKKIEANTISIKKSSPSRISYSCPYTEKCGGCNFQHLSYEEEKKYKEMKVKEILSKFGNISSDVILPVVSMEKDSYRNKIVLHGKDGVLGYYQKNSHEIVPIDTCEIVLPKINEIIALLKSIKHSISEVTIKCSNDQKEVLVDITGEVTNIEEIKNSCAVLILNGEVLTEKKSILTTIGDCSYKLSTHSFFQVNSELTKYLYDEVLNVVSKVQPKKVLDLYTGTGTIAIYVSKYCDHVIGIDYNESNIMDANQNKELNHIDNVTFICDKVENQIDQFSNMDLVIVDPPRSGLDSKTKEYLKKIASQQIVYVSCDPVTLARDLKDLSDTYQVISIKPFNMFPRTYHCESVCILERR